MENMMPGNESVMRNPSARLERARQFYSGAGPRFFDAWKRGVALAGVACFGDGTKEGYESATNKNQLRPNFEKVSKAIRFLSHGEAIFLAAMCSFFNSTTGAELMRKVDPEGVGALTNLDHDRRQVFADLLLNYVGW